MPYSNYYEMLPEEQREDYNKLATHDQELIDQEYPQVYSKNGAMLSIPEDEYWLAKTIFWEAEDSRISDDARIAVGWTARNRKEDPSPRWGTTYKDVVTAPGQFSPRVTNDELLREKLQDPIERASWERALEAARNVVADPDFCNPVPGVINFYSPISMDPPYSIPPWAPGMKEVEVPYVKSKYFKFFKKK